MPVEEFLETQDHPLIRHVLQHVYHLDNTHEHRLSNGQQQTAASGRLKPVIEITEGNIRFGPDRPPFLTYTGRKK